jgi:hypothetical protein
MSIDGALRFGRYAFPPNRLGYCGPPDHQALFEYVAQGRADAGLVELGRHFEGAYPYLQLIAESSGVGDPFDPRVVEAYWIGNSCLETVAPPALYESLRERFSPRMSRHSFEWLTASLAAGARPHHNFHVFDVYRRAGLMNDRHAPVLLQTMDRCRISWARVLSVAGDRLEVEREPLELSGGKLVLGAPRAASVERQIEGAGFAGSARVGDHVSVHWDWACEVLPPAVLQSLRTYTRRALVIANTTL